MSVVHYFVMSFSLRLTSSHHGGATRSRVEFPRRHLVVGRSLCPDRMVILASDVLRSHGMWMQDSMFLLSPAGTHSRQNQGGGQHGERHGRGLNANDLVLSSQFNWRAEEAKGPASYDSRAENSLFHLQARGTKRPVEGHGHESLAGGGVCGQKKVPSRDLRVLDNILGKGTGKGIRRSFVDKLKYKEKKAESSKGNPSARSHAPFLEVDLHRHEGAQTGMSKALEVASCTVRLNAAVEELKGNFWAASSKSSRDIKRAEILKLASKVNGGNLDLFPLKQVVVERVAACLKSAGMKSGDQYLNELKLMHIENGFDTPPWLTRVMGLCKKAMIRNKGPTKKAVESKIEDIREDLWQRPGEEFKGGINPALAYVWACLWMLREIEASACKWEHVQADAQSRRVSLYIPISKMDQGARGIKRTLQCCGQNPCMRFCAWNVWERMANESSSTKQRKGWMFVDKMKKQLSKAKMIENWKEATKPTISGHSARRSGAMEHVRQGLQIQELAFLGRWKSAVVLTYANDALQDMPANRMNQNHGEPGNLESMKSPWTPAAAPFTPKMQAIAAPSTPWMHAQGEAEQGTREQEDGNRKSKLWVAAVDKRKGKRTWHQVTKAGWQIALASWSTACGWHFTKNPEKVTLSVALAFNQARCVKCSEVSKARDKVKEGENLATRIQMDASAWFSSPGIRADESEQRASC